MIETKEVVCNVCGRTLEMKNGILREDAFEARKQWGYFSRKDAVMHSFVMCESCYDRIIDSFLIPPTVEEVTEL